MKHCAVRRNEHILVLRCFDLKNSKKCSIVHDFHRPAVYSKLCRGMGIRKEENLISLLRASVLMPIMGLT